MSAIIEFPARDAASNLSRAGTRVAKPNEDAVALAFAAQFGDRLRFCHSTGSWFFWNGKVWRREETALAFDYARVLCRQLNETGELALTKATTATSVERFARADRAFAVTSKIWDQDSLLLATPGGTVDLRTGELRPSNPEDYCTRLTLTAPAAPGSPHPCWSGFLDDATNHDPALIRFLQQIAGYCLTGSVQEHALFFIYGPGGNGKSVFLNVLTGIMGDLARTAPMETFTASKGDRHPTELAMLMGARLVAVSETEEGRPWAESRIKSLTGGDPITARFMRQDFFTFLPTFKLLIVGNHKPTLRNVDDAARRRFNIVPFLHKPPNPDRELEAKLRSEFPAILRWMIDGCLDWQRHGLVRPRVVEEATASYFSEQDLFQQWLAECCNVGDAQRAETMAALFQSWSSYALANGERPRDAKWLTQALLRRGCDPVTHTPGHRGKRGFRRIELRLEDTSGQWQNRVDT